MEAHTRSQSQPLIVNVKISFRISKHINVKNKLLFVPNVKWYNNFAIIKKTYTFTIFTSGFVNITGIPQINRIFYAVKALRKLIKIKKQHIQTEPKIDNTTSSGTFNQKINLMNLKEKIQQSHKNVKIKLNPFYFSGATFKFSEYGTIIIFSTGKYIIVGAKCYDHCLFLFNLINSFF